MSARSDNLRASSQKMINSYGKLVSYSSNTPGTYNTATGRMSSSSTSKSIRAVLSKVQRVSDKDGVQVGDLRLTVAALDLASPKPGDTITIDSNVWSVIEADPVYCDDDPVTFKLIARRT
jgi:hypothetical protein